MISRGIDDWCGREFKITYATFSSYVNERAIKLREYKVFTGELVNYDNTNRALYVENEKEIRIINLNTIVEMVEILKKSQ